VRDKRLLVLIGSLCLILVLAALPFVGACAKPTTQPTAPGEKVLKVGVIAALTGFGSAAEIHVRDGAVMAAEWINGNGGITVNGDKYFIVTVEADQKGTAEGAVAAARKLVDDDKCQFIVGGVVPYMYIAAGTVTEPAKVLRAVMYSCETPDELNANTPYTFKVNPGSIDGQGASLDYLLQRYPGVKTIGTITPADGAQDYLIPMIAKAAEERGLTQIKAVTWPMDTMDFSPVVTDLLSSHPDAMAIMNGWEMATGQMIKAARAMGFNGPIFMMNYDDPYAVLDIVGPGLTDFFTHGWCTDTTNPDMPALMKEVITTAQAKLGTFQQWNLWGWNGIYCLTQAIEHAQSLDPTQVANAWRGMTSIDTVFGPGKMGGEKTYGVKNDVCSRVAITEVVNGEVKHIKWVDVYIP
jgi:branched-chain amino acid transport system substrate-binding protein